MTSPSDITTAYAPLPVRARGTLEIFDTAFKLFRRYAGVLLAWSALSSLINLIPVVGFFIYIFTMPLLYGAVSCVVAGAVRGQKVGFKQIWGFTKPRYGALLGVLILALILLGVVMFILMFGVAMFVILSTSAASNYGVFAYIVSWIVGVIGGLIGSAFLLAVVMGWFNLAPVIACLEDAHRGSSALSRAWMLLKGNWRKACGVATILALAFTAAAMIISISASVLFYGEWDNFLGWDSSSSFLSGLAISGTLTLFFVAWTPLQAVVGAVFYLDLRTRKEALDLEWTNYAAKPETLPDQNAPAFNYQQPPAPPSFPTGGPPYAPASSLPATAQSVAQPPVFTPPPPPVFIAPSPVQPNQAQLNPAQLNPAQLNPAQLNPAQLNPAQLNPTQVNSGELNPVQLNKAQINPTQLSPVEPNQAQLNPSEFSSVQLNPIQPNAQVSSVQLSPVEPNQAQLSPAQFSSTQPNSVELNPTQLSPAQLNSTQLNSGELNLSQPTTVELSSAQPNAELNPTQLTSPPPPVFVAQPPAQPNATEPSVAAPVDSFAAFAAQVEAESTVAVPTPPTVEKVAPPLPVQPPPMPVPIQPPAAPEPEKTSSFAPPPRFRRERTEDDDNPSSFGGGAR